MKIIKYFFVVIYLFIVSSFSNIALAQNNINDVLDTSAVNQLIIISKKYGAVSLNGYMQPQFQYAQEKGTAAEFQGGKFGNNTDNRFRLRRGRLKADYSLLTDDGKQSTYFVFQFDGSEQGVNVRDFWGRYYENKFQLFYFTAGLAGRPFGNELQFSSSAREAPERGRMSQTLMKTERDLGVTFTFNPRKPNAKLKNTQIDLGIYNGQGLSGPQEFDNSKDFIFRLSHKKYEFKKIPFTIAGGFSALLGGLNHQFNTKYEIIKLSNGWQMMENTSPNIINKIAPRKYYGADVQLSTQGKKWKTELRAEYITGLQSATLNNSSTPGALPSTPYYTRNFNGAYLTFVQNLNSEKSQLILKYDWYDPNLKVSGYNIESTKGLSSADIKYTTLGIGFLHHINAHLKAVIYYDMIKNEKTKLLTYQKDIADNVLTIRTQFYF